MFELQRQLCRQHHGTKPVSAPSESPSLSILSWPSSPHSKPKATPKYIVCFVNCHCHPHQHPQPHPCPCKVYRALILQNLRSGTVVAYWALVTWVPTNSCLLPCLLLDSTRSATKGAAIMTCCPTCTCHMPTSALPSGTTILK